MPELRISLDQREYEKLLELKRRENKTWKDLLKANLRDNKDDEIREAIYDKYGDIKKYLGAFGRYDLLELTEIFRVLTLRSVKDGVDKKELIERMSELFDMVKRSD